MKHFFISALGLAVFFASFTGIYAGGARAEGGVMDMLNEIAERKARLSASLKQAFQSDWSRIETSGEEIISVKEGLYGCFHDDERFTAVKKLWSESCSEVMGAAEASGVLPYSFIRDTIAKDSELSSDKKLLPLLEAVYGEPAAKEAGEQAYFIANEFVPLLKFCDYETEIPALSCDSLIVAAKDEGFDYFQLRGAAEAAVSDLRAEYAVSVALKAVAQAVEQGTLPADTKVQVAPRK